ncbi:MAG: hypothetical protein IPL35_15210 [Sphingobacteriales bacterium]|nr:hypothetical protein [Sphingobacteriales bacterium]
MEWLFRIFFPLRHLDSRPHRIFTALFLVTSLYCAVLAAFPKLNNNINIYISSSAFGLWVWAFTLMLQPYYFNTFDIKNHTLSVGKLSIPAALKTPRMQYVWLFLLFVLGLAWRWYGIYNNDPTFDENFHLYAAKDLQRGVPSDYTRAWLVNHSISWLYVYFNPQTYHEHVYVAKIPGIILSSLAIFPVYFLGRLLSPAAGLMAAFLWVVSPWGVGTSRVIREYAFYPVFITLEIYLTYILMQVAFLKKKISLWGIVAIVLYLLFLSWYIFNIDPSSTIKIGLVFPIIAAVSFILVYADIIILIRKINWNRILYSLIPVTIATWILYKLLDKKIRAFSFTNPYENIDWFNTFLFPSRLVEHWWGDSNFIYLVLMVIFAGMSWAMLRRNRWFYIVLASFMLTVVAYYWFFFRLFQIRYIYYALPLFV